LILSSIIISLSFINASHSSSRKFGSIFKTF
jgi:hypothetical protein